MLLKIYKLESEEDPVAVFKLGQHTIGRGDDLRCHDKRVSRHHAVINVKEEEISLTSIHINPCFYIASGSKNPSILTQNQSMPLEDGDRFGLLPDMFWFKVRVVQGDHEESTLDIKDVPNVSSTTEELASASTSKRSGDEMDETETPKVKQMKIENGVEGDSSTAVEESNEVDIKEEPLEDMTVTEDVKKKEAVSDDSDDGDEKENADSSGAGEAVKQEEADASGNQNEDIKTEAEAESSENGESKVKKEEPDKPNLAPDDAEQPSSSVPRPRRERCWYGANCYRKNPLHRQDFTHPGDSDFASDPEDDRPMCSFGAQCYRRNKDHRKSYKHPPGSRPSKKEAKRKRKAAQKKAANAGVDYLSDDDEDDVSDPYDDDDSDEYSGGSESDDTDWEDSQRVEEDSQEIARLKREAKRFTRNT